MSSSQWITRSTGSFSECVDRIADAIRDADAILVGAGAGLSTAAGFSYAGKRFDDNFADFREAYGITDMYSGGFYPFPDEEYFVLTTNVDQQFQRAGIDRDRLFYTQGE